MKLGTIIDVALNKALAKPQSTVSNEFAFTKKEIRIAEIIWRRQATLFGVGPKALFSLCGVYSMFESTIM